MAARGAGGSGSKSATALLNEVIGSPLADLDLIEAAAELVAEDARFNRWVLARKPESTTVELWNLAAQARSHAESLANSWSNYMSADPPMREAGRQGFIDLMRAQRSELQRDRESNTVRFQDPDMPSELLDW